MVLKAMRLKEITQNVSLDGEEGQDPNGWGGKAQHLEVEEVIRGQQRTSEGEVHDLNFFKKVFQKEGIKT